MKNKIIDSFKKFRQHYSDWLHGHEEFPDAELYATRIMEQVGECSSKNNKKQSHD